MKKNESTPPTPCSWAYAACSVLDTGAGGLINPNKTFADVEKESALGHELYVKSHADFNVGEKLLRSYTEPNFQNTAKFGIPTPHDNTG